MIFTVGCFPLSSYITPKLEFKVPSPESSEHMIELTTSSWCQYFFNVIFYFAGKIFQSNLSSVVSFVFTMKSHMLYILYFLMMTLALT